MRCWSDASGKKRRIPISGFPDADLRAGSQVDPALEVDRLHGAAVLMIATIPVFLSLGSEFMPPMDEGAILYMPTAMPGISIAQAKRVLQATDLILKEFPEVDQVLGKAGRAETATDPAPLSMLETVITLKPRSQWRRLTPGTLPGPRNGQARSSPYNSGHHLHRRTHQARWMRPSRFRDCAMPGRCPSRAASIC
jgi:hypothetical protein